MQLLSSFRLLELRSRYDEYQLVKVMHARYIEGKKQEIFRYGIRFECISNTGTHTAAFLQERDNSDNLKLHNFFKQQQQEMCDFKYGMIILSFSGLFPQRWYM